MPYVEIWDVTKPTDADIVAQGDNEIRALKRSIDGRLRTVFSNWPEGEPLELNVQFGLTIGVHATRSAAPTSSGQAYYSYDQDRLFFSVPAEGASGWAWKEFKPGAASQASPTVTLTPASTQVTSGQSRMFTATATDPDGDVAQGTFEWYVNSVKQGAVGNSITLVITNTTIVRVVFKDTQGLTASAESVMTVGTASLNPPTGVQPQHLHSCSGGVAHLRVLFTWYNSVADAVTVVWRNGQQLAAGGPGLVQFDDVTIPAPGNYTYEFAHLKDGAYSQRTPLIVIVPDPCAAPPAGTQAPGSLQAVISGLCVNSAPVYSVNLSWNNSHADKETELLADGEIVQTVPAGTTATTHNRGASPGPATYTVRHKNGDGTVGPESNQAIVWERNEPCGGAENPL